MLQIKAFGKFLRQSASTSWFDLIYAKIFQIGEVAGKILESIELHTLSNNG